ncbi:flagellar hook-basal body complex protein [Paenibacillus albicereus]|uniref:Flagellar hook protein FlgE n=1 Tax=Paenibacillus albicereus TaxID=2726185 RepID=A0A6H2GY17_9BACL|nr:flagellar hook-basal body complex protein [Paenibacillus albicereus]QJC52282.1 flagellar hook-basal body complex protein [Paenibacillus albicereus]
MLRSMYSGVSGMRGFQTKLDVIGNNIANVNTVGFKAGRVMFQDILSQTVSGASQSEDGVRGGKNAQQIGLGVTVASVDTLHTAGSAMTTNVPTDLRIDGDGFFAVRPAGMEDGFYLTRAGNFSVDAAGQLVTADGGLVLSSDGEPISLAGISAYSIGKSGTIVGINADGTTGDEIATIGVVQVQNPNGLEKMGANLYRSTVNSNVEELAIGVPGDAETGTGTIVAGQLEMSNVDLTSEFTEMIVAQRGFQSNSRIITTSDEILQELVNLKR